VCDVPEHQQLGLFERDSVWAPNPLTYRDNAWAYCPAGTPDGHQWKTISDAPYEQVRDEVEARIAG
jgi:hypothetical protein